MRCRLGAADLGEVAGGLWSVAEVAREGGEQHPARLHGIAKPLASQAVRCMATTGFCQYPAPPSTLTGPFQCRIHPTWRWPGVAETPSTAPAAPRAWLRAFGSSVITGSGPWLSGVLQSCGHSLGSMWAGLCPSRAPLTASIGLAIGQENEATTAVMGEPLDQPLPGLVISQGRSGCAGELLATPSNSSSRPLLQAEKRPRLPVAVSAKLWPGSWQLWGRWRLWVQSLWEGAGRWNLPAFVSPTAGFGCLHIHQTWQRAPEDALTWTGSATGLTGRRRPCLSIPEQDIGVALLRSLDDASGCPDQQARGADHRDPCQPSMAPRSSSPDCGVLLAETWR